MEHSLKKQKEEGRIYIAIDLKSFYASVECRERGLDPLDTNLVVADESRTDKTICLAVTPTLKSYGISGRCRLFEVRQKLRQANDSRRCDAPGRDPRAGGPEPDRPAPLGDVPDGGGRRESDRRGPERRGRRGLRRSGHHRHGRRGLHELSDID